MGNVQRQINQETCTSLFAHSMWRFLTTQHLLSISKCSWKEDAVRGQPQQDMEGDSRQSWLISSDQRHWVIREGRWVASWSSFTVFSCITAGNNSINASCTSCRILLENLQNSDIWLNVLFWLFNMVSQLLQVTANVSPNQILLTCTEWEEPATFMSPIITCFLKLTI